MRLLKRLYSWLFLPVLTKEQVEKLLIEGKFVRFGVSLLASQSEFSNKISVVEEGYYREWCKYDDFNQFWSKVNHFKFKLYI